MYEVKLFARVKKYWREITIFTSTIISRFYFLLFGYIFTEPDSQGYRTFADRFGFTDDLAKISLLGDSFRPFIVNTLFGALPNDTARVIFTTFFAAIAWTYLFVTFKRHLGGYLYYLILTFTLSPSFIYRDLVILPDGLCLSIFLLLISFAYSYLFSTANLKLLVACVLFASILTIQRSTAWIGFTVLALSFILLLRIKNNTTLRTMPIILLVLSFLGFSYNQYQSNHGWPDYFNTKYPITKNVFPVGLWLWQENPLNTEWKSQLTKFGLPRCAYVNNVDKGPWEYTLRAFGSCKEASSWGEQIEITIPRLIVSNPPLIFNQIFREFPISFIPAPDPYRFANLVSVDFHPLLKDLKIPIINKFNGYLYLFSYNPYLLGFIIIGFNLIMLRFKISAINFPAMGLLLFSFPPLLFNNLIMPSDSFRHNLPYSFGILFSLILFTDRRMLSKYSCGEYSKFFKH